MMLDIGDVVTRTGDDRLRIIGFYEGCDEILVEVIHAETWADIGDRLDLLAQSVEFVERGR